MTLYGVVGRPILHSKSPLCHRFLADPKTSSYVRVLAETADRAVRLLRNAGFRGFNVTSPFKQSLVSFLDDVDPSVKDIGAVNTVLNDGGRWKGFNTDGTGALFPFRRRGIELAGLRGVVLGAGGAGRAAAAALVRNGCRVTIINRTEDKAKAFASVLGCSWNGFRSLNRELWNADLLINTVPLDPRRIRDLVLPKRLVVLDALYRIRPFLEIARRDGCRYFAGEEWLLGQALESFALFEGAGFDRKSPPSRLFDPVFRPAKLRRVSLVGFMGAGKTTAGRLLADRLRWPFIETDRLIAADQRMSVEEIFRRQGEGGFRTIESRTVKKALGRAPAVLSLGGGAVLRPETADALKRRSLVVWIHVSPETALRRIQGTRRPLLKDCPDEASFSSLWNSRLASYAAVSDLMIDGEFPPANIARIIHEEIRRLSSA